MTRESRIAATECVWIMALLADSDIENGKALAVIVSARLLQITEQGVADPLTEIEIAPWAEIGRLLKIHEERGYLIVSAGAAIMCLRCGAVSHNPNDVKQRYCGRCAEFHEENRHA